MVSPSHPLVSLGFTVLLVYLFLVNSRILDLLPGMAVLRIPMTLMLVYTATAILSGTMARVLKSSGTKVLLVLFAWIGVTTVLSVWRTGSLEYVKHMLLLVLLYPGIVSLVQTIKDLRRVILTLAVSVTVSALLSFVGRGDDTRLALSGGTYGDPNGFAAALLFALPLCFVVSVPGQRSFWSAFGWIATVPILVSCARTGSRGGMIAFLLISILLFFRVSIMKKLVLIVVGLVLGGAFLTIIPESIRVRYLTLFGSPNTPTNLDLGGAEGSSEARLALLQLSIKLTFENPIFGVGPGMFPVAGDLQAKEAGHRHGTWQVTHNTYTQVSSELGFIGLALFLGLLYSGWRNVRKVALLHGDRKNPDLAVLRQIAIVLEFSFLGFCVSALFLSLFYWMNWVMLIACMTCLDHLVKQQLEAARRIALTNAPAPHGKVAPAVSPARPLTARSLSDGRTAFPDRSIR